MAIFKYTVANQQGKNLIGTIEAPDENTARNELNQLNFSIVSLEETNETPQIDDNLKHFLFEAIDKKSNPVSGSVPSKTIEEAKEKLKNEYNLKIINIWEKSEEEISEKGKITKINLEKGVEDKKEFQKETQTLQETEKRKKEEEEEDEEEDEEEEIKNFKEEKRKLELKTKIEETLQETNKLLKNFSSEFSPEENREIQNKINKLLRIKQSTNINYILETANELLKFIKEKSKTKKEEKFSEKKVELQVKTIELIEKLNIKKIKKTLSEDIFEKIIKFEKKHSEKFKSDSNFFNYLKKLLNFIKIKLQPSEEIQTLKKQIKLYNHQLINLIKLYFKEPTKEYKQKVKEKLKITYKTRNKTKRILKSVKKTQKAQKKPPKIKESMLNAFLEELNGFSGWLLAFYLIYYFIGLFLNNKDFGLNNIPEGFLIYESQIFKYILIIIFLLHASTSIKLIFFKKNILANIFIPIIFIFATIITLLNF